MKDLKNYNIPITVRLAKNNFRYEDWSLPGR